MQLHELNADSRQDRQRRKRVGRGGKRGKTSGRGTKGQGSRTGKGRRRGFEGGQSSIIERYPKLRGKKRNAPRNRYAEANLSALNVFEDGAAVRLPDLREKGIVSRSARLLKILGDGKLTKKLSVFAHAFSATAKMAIEKAGGTVSVLPLPVRKGAKPKAERTRTQKAA